MGSRSRTPAASGALEPGASGVLDWFATRQAGHVARRQLLAAGLTGRTIQHRRESVLLGAGFRGVYRVGHHAPTEWAKETAAVLACGPGALVSHRSAARVHGILPYPAVGDAWVTVTTARAKELRGVRVCRTRTLDPADVAFAGWLPLTSPARTIIDLAGVVDAEQLEQAVAESQAGRLVTEQDLRRELARRHGARGGRALRMLLDRHFPPAATRSRAERLMLRLIRSANLPEPLVNARLGRWRPDFYWPDHRLVAEFDSFEFHSDIRAFRRDREKSNQLQLMGIIVLRFTWDELTRRPAVLQARLRKALGLG